jgi:hypothetical protein
MVGTDGDRPMRPVFDVSGKRGSTESDASHGGESVTNRNLRGRAPHALVKFVLVFRMLDGSSISRIGVRFPCSHTYGMAAIQV